MTTEDARQGGEPEFADLRPILCRTSDNTWQRCEAIREELYRSVESACRKRQINALVLQSNPYQHPVWVKYESWMPIDGSALTARASVLIIITPIPYHRYDVVYTIGWEIHGRFGQIGPLYRLETNDIDRLLDCACAEPDGENSVRRVKSIFAYSCLRAKWWEFWQPQNKLTAIRHDYVKSAFRCVLLLGILVVAHAGIWGRTKPVAQVPQNAPGFTSEIYQPAVPEPVQRPVQRPVQARPHGEPPVPISTTGRLGVASSKFPDGGYYDEYAFEKRPATQAVITMRTSQLHPHIVVGQASVDGFNERWNSESGSESEGVSTAFLTLTPEVRGNLLIRAGSTVAGETGDYALEVLEK